MFSKTKKDDTGAAPVPPVAPAAPAAPQAAPAVEPRLATPRPTVSPSGSAAHAPAAAALPAQSVAPAPSPSIKASPAPSPAPRSAAGSTVRSTSSAGDPVVSNPAPRPAAQQPRGSQTLQEAGKLIVGREIKLKGEITSCERLVVEGSLEAALMDSRTLDVTPGGHFKGMAVVDSATISGHFDGELTVEGLLTVTSTGRIIGTIRFGELEVERGGTLSGDIAIAGTPARASGGQASDQDE